MEKDKYLIGIDIGTSSAKMTVIGLGGSVVFEKSNSYPIDYLEDGKVEQDPNNWYKATASLIKEFLSSFNFPDILSIGISSQSNALVAIDKNGKVLHPAILYLDKRASGICDSFSKTEKEDRIYKITGSTLKPSYTGPQIAWMKENRPDVYKDTFKFLTANGYVNYMLTGSLSQDITQTGMTGIFDRKKGDWSSELLGLFDIDKFKLPPIYKAADIIGKTGKDFEKESGLKSGVPVVAGTLDVASTMLGSGAVDSGACHIEMGSVINITVLTDTQINDRNLQTYPSAVPGINIVAGSVDGAGNTIKWYLDEIYRGTGSDILDKDIFSALEKNLPSTTIGADNLMFLPFMAGMRTPRSDLKSKGAFLGLKISHKKIDIYRAILEGCAYGLKYNLEFILAKELILGQAIVSGGGSLSKFWMQMFSDVLDKKIKRSLYCNGASLGSAMLAGIGSDVFKDYRHAAELVCKYDRDFIPVSKRTEIYKKYYKKYTDFMEDIVVELDSLARIDKSKDKKSSKGAFRVCPGSVECRVIPKPELDRDKILVRTLHTGICGSDIARIKESDPKWDKVILGHEAVGMVEDLSQDISSKFQLKKGDRVAVIPLIPCHRCYFCQKGMYSLCKDYSFIGSRQNGTLSEYLVASPKNLIKLPQDGDILKYTLLEPLTVALHAIYKTGIKYSKSAAVFGAGPIGLLLFEVLNKLTNYEVVVADIDSFKLDLAKKLGSVHNINPAKEDIGKYIEKNIDSTGVDTAFEVSGANQARIDAIKALIPGGDLVLVGTSPQDAVFDGPTFELITRKELKITGTWMSYSAPFPGDEWKAGIKILKDDLIDIEPLITHRYKLEDIGNAIGMILGKENNYCKVIIDI